MLARRHRWRLFDTRPSERGSCFGKGKHIPQPAFKTEHGSLAFYSLSSKIALKDLIVRLRKPGTGAGLDAQASNRGLNIFLGFSYVFGA